MSSWEYSSFRSYCACFSFLVVVAACGDLQAAQHAADKALPEGTLAPTEQRTGPPTRLQGRLVASADTARPLAGVLKVTNCSNETLEARAGSAGFEIAFDPADCARCGDWRMVAQPEDESFLWTTCRIACDSTQPIVVRCPSKSRVLREIDKAIAAADWGRATLISSDLHARTGEPRALETYKEATAEFFSVPRETAWKKDVQQGKEVATPQLVEKIKAFQKETGLRTTGVIDFPTAVKMAVESGATSGVGSAPLYREIVR